jgi:hypothetical protein
MIGRRLSQVSPAFSYGMVPLYPDQSGVSLMLNSTGTVLQVRVHETHRNLSIATHVVYHPSISPTAFSYTGHKRLLLLTQAILPPSTRCNLPIHVTDSLSSPVIGWL